MGFILFWQVNVHLVPNIRQQLYKVIQNYYISYKYLLYSLLMPKIIASRRTNKNVTVEDYWAIRQNLSKKKENYVVAYKQKQVQKRHRFMKLRDQIKLFNPLQYFVTKDQNFSTDQKTHTHAYLQSINYRLPEQIMQVKKLMFGLASIIKNLQPIYTTLWEHLGSEDAWRLLQSLLKDTRQQSYQIWKNNGLQLIVKDIGNQFKQSRFKQIFATICLFMQVCFSKICENQNSALEFMEKMSEFYFSSPNKYIRTFSVKACSYVLSNMQQDLFYKLIILIIQQQENNLSKDYLGDILAQRLKYSNGCLTPNSLQQLINIINWINQVNIQERILTDFIYKVLSNLQQIRGIQENQTLFDFGYIIKAFLHLCRDKKIKAQCFIEGIVIYLQEQIKDKHEKKRRLNQQNLLLVSQFLWQSLPQLTHDEKVYHLLALSFSLQLQNVSNIKDYLLKSQDEQIVLMFLQFIGSQLKKQTVMLLMASFKNIIQEFISSALYNLTQSRIIIVFKLFLLSKRHLIKLNIQKFFSKNVQLNKQILKLTKWYQEHPTDSDSKIKLYEYTLVFLRYLTIIELSNNLQVNLKALYNETLKDYNLTLEQYFRNTKNRSNKIFCCQNYVQQIFLYSHSSIPFVWQGFNILQSFIQIQKNTKRRFINREAKSFHIWHKIIVNRTSIVNQISQILKNQSQDYLYVLQSRHRAVRLMTLQHIKNMKITETHSQLFNMIQNIDRQDIDLDNQRDVKRMFLDMLRYISQNQLEIKTNKILLSWCLGFAFTGFKLIQQSFTNFLAALLQNQNEIDFSILINFLQFYTFKNSRVYEKQIQNFYSDLSLKALKLPKIFTQLTDQDFQNHQLQTVEFIGIDRVTLAISKSQKIKKRIQSQLLNLLNQFFEQEFVRHKTTLLGIKNNEHIQPNLILPPKTTFLKHILKLTPSSYEAPIQCVHYTSQYLKTESVRNIKKQQWQLLWHKSTKMQQQRIKFENMSSRQMDIYINFLWSQILKADSNRLRIIIEYIRDNMNHKISYFMNIFYNEVTLGVTDDEVIRNIFVHMDSRKFLTFIYILKAIVKTLRNYIRNNQQKILKIIINALQALQCDNKQKIAQQIDVQQKQIQAQGQDEEIQNIEQEQNIPNQQSGKNKKYKNHRRELFKILTSLITIINDQVSLTQIDHIFSTFQRQNKIQNLAQSSTYSTPGLLLFVTQLSKFVKFHELFVKYQIVGQISQIFGYGYRQESYGSVLLCIQILNNILRINNDNQMIDQSNEKIQLTNETYQNILSNIRTFLLTVNKLKIQKQCQILRIILQLTQKCHTLQKQWQKYLMVSMARIVSMKVLSSSNNQKLCLLLQISMNYSRKSQNSEHLINMLILVPQLKQIQHRKIIVNALAKDVQSGKQKNIRRQVVNMTVKINSTVDGGLVKQINYADFFEGINQYKQSYQNFGLYDHQFFMYNLLAYISSQQLSVRKAVSSSLELFLSVMKIQHKQLIARLFRIVSEQLKRPNNGQQQIFWSIIMCMGYFISWIVNNDSADDANYYYLKPYITDNKNQQNLFENLCSLSQKQKLNGLKCIKTLLSNQQLRIKHNMTDRYPNILTSFIIPVLQHFIMPQVSNVSNKYYQISGNLTSSLSHVSLQVYQLAMKKGGESLQKKQLKRMVSKLKFDQSHLKKNILIIKIIGQVIESINLPKVTESIHKIIQQQGFEDFHKKLLQKEGKSSKIQEQADQSQSQEQVRKKIAFNGINNQIEDEQLINIGYLTLDKKLIQAEDEQNKNIDESVLSRFLRVNVLLPLKTMLMFENRSQKNSKQQTDKSRMLLSVVVTKIILKFPVDVFLNQLQKIISKLAKLLRKRQVQIRDYSRLCLAEIARLVGPDLFYIIFRELKFHLRDNFQQHIMNYTIFYVLQKYGNLEYGAIDHCLPILLPSIIDELYGKTAHQKQMVDQNLIPTINIESKKRKSNELLTIICKQISINKIEYLVKYFEKFLLQYMNSEANITKYEQILTNIFGGLGRNQKIMTIQNSNRFIQILHQSIQKLKGQIKIYKFQDLGLKHESTVKQQINKGKKIGKQVMQIQEQAGRNASIFKKHAKQIQERRNHQILIGCFMQFYLGLLALLLKKKIINSEQNSQKFESIITFIVQCIQHRDNRLVHKCLKVIHNVIHWKKLQNILQIRKKASRKIFALIEKLTNADEDLLRQCFTILNDLFQQVNITSQVLHILISIIKLHITTVEKIIAEQPYKLLKTVLIKISPDPNLVFDQAVYQLYQFVRATLISTNMDQIRNICRQICCIYIRQQAQPQTELTNKNRNRTTLKIDYNKQISFYLNNLDCKYSQNQSAILDVLKTYITWQSKQQVQETGEVIIMSLGTSFANDSDNQFKIREVIRLVVQKIDNAKVVGLIDKCLIWAQNQENQLISVCGYFLLQALLALKMESMNSHRKEQVQRICLKTLQKQNNNVLIYEEDVKQRAVQLQRLKQNPEWKNIIQPEQVNLKMQKNFKSAINITELFLNQFKKLANTQIEVLWKLVSAPSELIHSKVGSILLKTGSILPVIGPKILQLRHQQQLSLKTKIIKFVKNLIHIQKVEHGSQLIRKVFLEIKEVQNVAQITENIIINLLNRISRSILNLKRNQRSMDMAYDVLQIILSTDPELNAKLFKTEKLLGEILWNIAKVSRNQLIGTTIKEKNQALSQIIKANIGQAEFYRKLANIQAERKQKRNSQKSEMLKLAITDQQAYGMAKLKKKHKKV